MRALRRQPAADLHFVRRPNRVRGSIGTGMSRLGLCVLLLAGAGLSQQASAQDTVSFKPAAWFAALTHEYHTSFMQVQVGQAREGPVVKAVIEDSVAAALPLERQEAAAREVARYIIAHAAPEPRLEVVIVGWRGTAADVAAAQTFRFLAGDLVSVPPKAQSQ